MTRLASVPLLLLTILAVPAHAGEELKAVFRRCAPATVAVECQPDAEGNVSFGSGCLIDPAGVVLTNHHVIEPSLAGDRRVRIRLFDGREFWGQVVESDEEIDLALVHVLASPGSLPMLEFGDSDEVEVGDDCLAIGNPDGLSWSLSTGVISGKRGDLLQTTAPLNPGNSGGPLLSDQGRLIGINTYSMYEGRDNIAFSRASAAVQAWLSQKRPQPEAARPPTRTETSESDVSFVPPSGWTPMATGADPSVQFKYKAPEGTNRRSPGYVEVKRIERADYASLEDLVADVKDLYSKRYSGARFGQEKIFDLGGETANAGFLEVRYRTGSVELVESNFLVLGTRSIHVFKFVVLESAWTAIEPAAFDAFRSVRWDGAGSQGTSPYSTPERAVQAMVDAALAKDLDRFMDTLHPLHFFDRLTGGEYAKQDAPDQEAMRKGIRNRFAELLEKGQLLAGIQGGAVVLPGHRDTDLATVRLVTTGGDGAKTVDEVELSKSGEDWKVAFFGNPKPFDPDAVPRQGGPVKTKSYRHPEGLFELEYPDPWSTSELGGQNGSTIYYFSPGSPGGEEDLTERVTVQVVARSDLSGYTTLSPENLKKFSASIEKSLAGTYEGTWQVAAQGETELSGLAAVYFVYVAMRTPISPVVKGKVTITFHRGTLYVIQRQVKNEGAEAVEKRLEEIERSLEIPG